MIPSITASRIRGLLPLACFFSLGLGILLPWNITLIQIPFLRTFVSSARCLSFFVSVAFSMPIVPVALLALAALSRVRLATRVVVLASAQAVTLLLLLVGAQAGLGFLLSVVVLMSAQTVLTQASLYGYASTLPASLSRALMIGQGATGILSSAMQILAQLFITFYTDVEEDVNHPAPADAIDWAAAVVCSCVGTAVVFAGAAGYWWLTQTADGRAAMLELETTAVTAAPLPRLSIKKHFDTPTDALTESGSDSPRRALLNPSASGLDTASSEPTTPVVTMPDALAPEEQQHLLIEDGGEAAAPHLRSDVTLALLRKNVMPFVSLFLVLFGTMLVFPGVLLDLPYVGELGPLQDPLWWPTILLALYNVSDFIGRFLPSLSSAVRFTDAAVLSIALTRLALFPALLFAASAGAVRSDVLIMLLAFVLGLSNGLLQVTLVVEIPRRASPSTREKMGNLISATINIGIVLGSVAALGLSPSECIE